MASRASELLCCTLGGRAERQVTGVSGRTVGLGKTQCDSHCLDMPVLCVFRLSLSEVLSFVTSGQKRCSVWCTEIRVAFGFPASTSRCPAAPPQGRSEARPSVARILSLEEQKGQRGM